MGPLRRIVERFWFLPGVMCLAAVALSELLITLDTHLDEPVRSSWSRVLFYRVGESGTRDILGTIATATLGVAGTTFSITMAVLALTSSSYGPRLVRNFMADRANQMVLGVFVATFLYSLLVLRSVGGSGGVPEGGSFVPHLAVNAAIVLALANVAAMVYFIHHISDSIQISTLSGGVRTDLHRVIDRTFPAAPPGDPSTELGDPPLPLRARVTAREDGYLQVVRHQSLLKLARRQGFEAVLLVRPGQYVMNGTPMLALHATRDIEPDAVDKARRLLEIDNARSPHQDIDFAVQQLTEMAVRALSPGTNDPNTAINALDDLSSGLATLASRPVPSGVLRDEQGVVRVRLDVPDPVQIVTDVLDRLRWHASASPSVMHAALTLIERVGARAHAPALVVALTSQIGLLRDAFVTAGHHAHDVDRFDLRAVSVSQNMPHC